jgi:hypothetical protein
VKTAFAIAYICLAISFGALKILAGVHNYQRRNRALGLIALGTAPLSVLTFICVPSALAIMVYGLIVYLHRDVKRAFAPHLALFGVPPLSPGGTIECWRLVFGRPSGTCRTR